MSNAFIEPLQSRLMLHNTGPLKPMPPREESGYLIHYADRADTNHDGSASFDELVKLAKTYGGGEVDYKEVLALAQHFREKDSSFIAEWALASAFAAANPPPAVENWMPGNTSITFNKKGKLIVEMGIYNNARIFREGASTTVWLNHVSRGTEGHTAEIQIRSYKGVKSIEVNGTDKHDSVTLFDGLRFTTVRTGVGDDTIRGGDGASALYGGDGDDEIYAGGGDDSLFGEAGNDHLNGETGNDLLDGGAGKDKLDGGKGRNKLAGGSGTDYLSIRVGRDKTDRDAKDKLTELA